MFAIGCKSTAIDAGGSDDPTSIMVAGFYDEHMYVWNHQYLSEEGYKRREGQNHYDSYLARGELTICPVGQDLRLVMDVIRNIDSSKLSGIAIDPYRMKAFKHQIEQGELITDDPFAKVRVVDCPQNWKMSSFIAEADRMIFQGLIHHNGNSMLRWNIANAKIAEKGRAVALEKPDNIAWSKDKIDGAICLVMVLMGRNELPEALGADVSWWIG
jgi:phage terminase large subunit-like protein